LKSAGILMLATSMQTMGGISSVLVVYRDDGLFERWPLEHVVTHRDGGAVTKALTAGKAFVRVLTRLIFARPALIHLHVSSRASFWRKSVFMAMARAFGVPYLLHLHGSEFQVFYERECGPTAKSLVRSFFAHASHVIVLSSHWAEWVQGMCPSARIETVFNPVILPPREPEFAAREPQTLLFLGRLGERKGTYVLLQAVQSIAAEFPKLRVLLGGDGEVDKVRATAAELGIAGCVETLGWVGADQRRRLLSEASIYVLPSFHEGLPMSILEAMAAGMPIVSTVVGGIPEAVDDGVEGLIVAPGDPVALAAALRRLLGDAAERERMGHAARERVRREFATSAVLPRIEALYAERVVRR